MATSSRRHQGSRRHRRYRRRPCRQPTGRHRRSRRRAHHSRRRRPYRPSPRHGCRPPEAPSASTCRWRQWSSYRWRRQVPGLPDRPAQGSAPSDRQEPARPGPQPSRPGLASWSPEPGAVVSGDRLRGRRSLGSRARRRLGRSLRGGVRRRRHAASRRARGPPPPPPGVGRGYRLLGLIRAAIERRLRLELLLGHRRDQPAVTVTLSPLELGIVDRDVLLADAEETADADHHGLHVAVGADDDIVDVADILSLVSAAVIARSRR